MDSIGNGDGAPESVDDAFSLRSAFSESERIVEAVDADSASGITVKHAVGSLQTCAKCVSVLALFSRNETLDDVATSSMPYLLIPVYLGFLTQHLTVDNRNCPEGMTHTRSKMVSASLEYYRQGFKLFRDYAVPGAEFIPQAARAQDDDGDEVGRTRVTPAVSDAQRREHNIKRYRRQQDLNARIKHAARDAVLEDGDSDDELRALYASKLEFWLVRSAEEFDLLSRESDILKSIQKASPAEVEETRSAINSRTRSSDMANGGTAGFSSGANVVKLDANSYQSLLTPVRLLRFEERKKVFGAGYPSLPKYSIEEYYDVMARQGKLPDGGCCSHSGAGRSKVTRVEPSAADETSAEEQRKARRDREESDDDEVALQKARSWDEFKDDNPRGWGNRKNKG